MVEILAQKTHLTGKRNRVLDRWNVQSDKGGCYLTGIVLMGENELPLAEDANLRVTSTSYIDSINGCSITTISGSTYFLMEPSINLINYLKDLNLQYNPQNPLEWL